MSEIDVKNLENEVVGKIELSDEIFGAEFNQSLIWEAVQHYAASVRSGTASTKTRAMVSGSGKKLWRQKGTGRARIGSIRSPLWRHGGTVHGPQPRDFSYRFPKKKLRGAMRSALSAKLQQEALTVVENLSMESHKTKDFVKVLETLSAKGKVLIVSDRDKNLHLSSRNVPGVKLVPHSHVNIFDVVNSENLIFSKEAILQIQEVLSR